MEMAVSIWAVLLILLKRQVLQLCAYCDSGIFHEYSNENVSASRFFYFHRCLCFCDDAVCEFLMRFDNFPRILVS